MLVSIPVMAPRSIIGVVVALTLALPGAAEAGPGASLGDACVPISSAQLQCARRIALGLSKFGTTLLKCHAKQAAAAFAQRFFVEEACETEAAAQAGEADQTQL